MKPERWLMGVVAALFILSYLITWVFGIPAIYSQTASNVAAWQQTLEGQAVDIKPIKPYHRFGPAFAVFPGLIVCKQEWQVSSTGGEWGWSLYLWYGSGIKRLFFRGVVS